MINTLCKLFFCMAKLCLLFQTQIYLVQTHYCLIVGPFTQKIWVCNVLVFTWVIKWGFDTNKSRYIRDKNQLCEHSFILVYTVHAIFTWASACHIIAYVSLPMNWHYLNINNKASFLSRILPKLFESKFGKLLKKSSASSFPTKSCKSMSFI